MISLPTNKDENWRYANLRPLAKANADAVAAVGATTPASIALPVQLPDYERWVFVDGRFAANLSAPSPDSCASLLDARDAWLSDTPWRDVEAAWRAACAIGATSGADALSGLLGALRAWHPVACTA